MAFWDKVVRNSGDGCWLFTGYKNPDGYGRLRHKGRLTMATRVALELVGRPRPSDRHFALHSCDNPPCCNPSHLRWGTKAENAADAMERGRIYLQGLTGRGNEKWKTRLLQQAEARERAKALPCPECSAKPFAPCVGKTSHRRGALHLARIKAA
jgi:hypothetical protein